MKIFFVGVLSEHIKVDSVNVIFVNREKNNRIFELKSHLDWTDESVILKQVSFTSL